jgi:hydroxybutyrate-dimer hydrolase
VHSRNDGVVPSNNSSRAYYGVNQIVESKRSNLHYYEVTNANHLNNFLRTYSFSPDHLLSAGLQTVG